VTQPVGVLDHLIFGAPALEDGVRQLERRFGLRAQPGGRHRGLGTHNALLGLDHGAYLEIIAPDPAQPPPATPRPFGLDALDHPRLAGWAVRCDDIDTRVAHARAQGYDPGDPVELQRATTQGTLLRWRLTPNALAGGPVPFLIDWGDTAHPSTSTPPRLTLVSFHLEHPQPEVLTGVLAALAVEVPVEPGPTPGLVARIAGPDGSAELR
jgi:Glyoxalase-like domain